MSDEAGTAVVDFIRSLKLRYGKETDLQFALWRALNDAGWNAIREVRLAPGERIDVMVDRIGIEVKVGGYRPADVLAQLRRYAMTRRVDELILVTNRARHEELNGVFVEGVEAVPVTVVRLVCL